MNAVKVRNTQARLMQVQEQDPKTKAHTLRTLKPGVNLVSPELVEQMKKSVVVLSWIEKGHLVIEDTVPDQTRKTLDDLGKVEAVKLVNDTLDIDQLVAWKDASKKPHVIAAIETQLAKIDAGAAEESRKE